ncbi:TPA: hypothetical protein MIX56_25820 [Klebsiella pneumoniae]|nr:hypothetical protein [Klebsiella pneumoniae]HBY5377456.1 hypothetical protein [Klebsiella pneumoniae]HBY5382934.1 hypothetical protein [Klebsiella pneumoniae]HBY5400029.1 hypothetical protein [Klebsiella pneumoniae]HBY5405557.1 hypothetical protein [Klebsiella pneumoniae]
MSSHTKKNDKKDHFFNCFFYFKITYKYMVFKSFFNRNKVFLVPKNLICFYIIKQGFRFALPLKDKVKGKS